MAVGHGRRRLKAEARSIRKKRRKKYETPFEKNEKKKWGTPLVRNSPLSMRCFPLTFVISRIFGCRMASYPHLPPPDGSM